MRFLRLEVSLGFDFDDLAEIRVPVEPDADGYVGRECPNAECEAYFKITPGTGLTDPAPCHCPYCGHVGESSEFFTKEQIEYGKSIAMRKFAEAFGQTLKALEFDHRPRGGFGIGISLKVTPGAPIPIQWYREKELETEATCDDCGLRYAIYGVFGWCPDCGVHNSLQILGLNLELARKKLDLAQQQEQVLADTIIADALAGLVSAFDGFGRELCSGRQVKASFQNLESGRKRVEQEFGFNLAAAIMEEEWRSAIRSFQKRHLFAHKMGVVDEEYVEKAVDPTAVVGRKILLEADEVRVLVSVLGRLGECLYRGIMGPKAGTSSSTP